MNKKNVTCDERKAVRTLLISFASLFNNFELVEYGNFVVLRFDLTLDFEQLQLLFTALSDYTELERFQICKSDNSKYRYQINFNFGNLS